MSTPMPIGTVSSAPATLPAASCPLLLLLSLGIWWPLVTRIRFSRVTLPWPINSTNQPTNQPNEPTNPIQPNQVNMPVSRSLGVSVTATVASTATATFVLINFGALLSFIPPRTRRATRFTPGLCISMLIGACNPMLCPIFMSSGSSVGAGKNGSEAAGVPIVSIVLAVLVALAAAAVVVMYVKKFRGGGGGRALPGIVAVEQAPVLRPQDAFENPLYDIDIPPARAGVATAGGPQGNSGYAEIAPFCPTENGAAGDVREVGSSYGENSSYGMVRQLRHHFGPFLPHFSAPSHPHAPCAVFYVVPILIGCWAVPAMMSCPIL